MHHYDVGWSCRFAWFLDRDLLRAVACSRVAAQFTAQQRESIAARTELFGIQRRMAMEGRRKLGAEYKVDMQTTEHHALYEEEPEQQTETQAELHKVFREAEGVPTWTGTAAETAVDGKGGVAGGRTATGTSPRPGVSPRGPAGGVVPPQEEPLIQDVPMAEEERERGQKREGEAEPGASVPAKARMTHEFPSGPPVSLHPPAGVAPRVIKVKPPPPKKPIVKEPSRVPTPRGSVREDVSPLAAGVPTGGRTVTGGAPSEPQQKRMPAKVPMEKAPLVPGPDVSKLVLTRPLMNRLSL